MLWPPYPADYQKEVDLVGDSVRVASIGLFVSRLDREGILGDFAELGVYRGDVSRLLHKLAPTRDLYLFDSFSGFADDATDSRFRDASIDVVRRTIGGDSAKLHFRRGWFPSTVEGLEDRMFAFVHLDGDDSRRPLTACVSFIRGWHAVDT